MVTVGGPSRTGVKSRTVVAPLLCSMRRNIEGGNPTAVATRACKEEKDLMPFVSIKIRSERLSSCIGCQSMFHDEASLFSCPCLRVTFCSLQPGLL